MHLMVSMQLILKDVPKEQPGIRSYSLTFGKDEPLPFSDMVLAIVSRVLDRYLLFADAETLNAELVKIREVLAGIVIEDAPNDDEE